MRARSITPLPAIAGVLLIGSFTSVAYASVDVDNLTTIASFVDEISEVQGANGWSYGYYDGDAPPGGDPFTPDDFELLPEIDPNPSAFGPVWRINSGLQPGGFFTAVGKEFAHPNATVPGFDNANDTHSAVIRWQPEPSEAGTAYVRIQIGDWDGGGGNGVVYQAYLDDVLIGSGQTLNSSSTDFQIDDLFEVTLTPTSILDVAILPNRQAANDGTRVRVDVLVPEPAAALATAALGLLGCRHTRRSSHA